jgi:competence protein ComEC
MRPSADERLLLCVVPSAFGAAFLGGAIPWWLAAATLAVGLVLVRPLVVVAALVLLIGARAQAVSEALMPVATAPVEELWIHLVQDPRASDVSWRAVAEVQGDTVMVEGRGAVAARLSALSAGDRLQVSGTQRGSSPRTAWQRSQGLVGRIDVSSVDAVAPDEGVRGRATQFRNNLASGAASLDTGDRALFTGLVYGDDREQTAVAADNFRAAGLGHLLAVSGQNVVFVLLVATPVLSRIRSVWIRLLAALCLLVFFGFVTRFEPSVTRALVMAGLAAVASANGSPAAAVRVLPAAVVGLLLLTPLLAWSLAFQLSVAATSGLVLFSHRIQSAIPGPEMIAAPLAATAAAQLAVAPLLLSTFGSVSLLALPANLLAGPAAAFVMMWGLTAGSLAGLLPPWAAALIHVPTRLAIDWIELVAAVCADVPVGRFAMPHFVALVTGAVLWARGSSHWRWPGMALCTLALLVPLVGTPALEPGQHELADGVVLVRSETHHDVLIVDRTNGVEDVLEAIREARIGRIDLLLVPSGSRSAGRLTRTLAERFEITDIWAPAEHQVPGARLHPERGNVGGLTIAWPSDGFPVVFAAGERADTASG